MTTELEQSAVSRRIGRVVCAWVMSTCWSLCSWLLGGRGVVAKRLDDDCEATDALELFSGDETKGVEVDNGQDRRITERNGPNYVYERNRLNERR